MTRARKILISFLIISVLIQSFGILFAPSQVHVQAQEPPFMSISEARALCTEEGIPPGDPGHDACVFEKRGLEFGERTLVTGDCSRVRELHGDAAAENCLRSAELRGSADREDPLPIPDCNGWADGFRPTCIWRLMMNGLLGLSSYVLFWAGALFDFTIRATVVEMGERLDNLPVVNIGWAVFRDFVNIFFIFILLYIAISTILGLGVNTKSILVRLILVALLINFSLFVTKVVIDISNVVAVGFYQEILNDTQDALDESNTSAEDAEVRGFSDAGISQMFMNRLKLTTIYDPESTNLGGVPAPIELNDVNLTLIALFGSLFMLVVAFVFFAGAILFALRFIVFIFLMVLAPLAFFGMILPKTRSYASDWWDALLNQAYFAPLYLAFTFVVIRGLNSIAGSSEFDSGIGGETLAAAFATGATGSLDVVLNFIVIVGLATGSLMIAKDLSVRGAGATIKFGGNIQKWGQGKVAGTPGSVLRNTAGRYADYVARDERSRLGTRLKDAAASKNIFIRKAGEAGLKSAQRTSEARFGFANLPGASKKTGKGGFKKRREDQVKAEVKFAGSLGTPREITEEVKSLKEEIELLGENIKKELDSSKKAEMGKNLEDKIERLAELEKRESQKARQLGRAETLKQRRIIPRSTLGREPSQFAVEAAGKIEKETKKSKEEIRFREILKDLTKEEKGGGEDSGDSEKEDDSS